ncbi:hypothetical protein ACHHYP_04243 [Achlya hypogyna]|uniref:Protein FAM221A n=1 Tax=Achlya hypogyna TaxID=1202772 RepID=A0A1V9ZPF0_ACHHY|nr:hypothetical protein ACHHYP_04243 [Achlya hypogyna]
MPQEWYAAHDAVSASPTARDPSKLLLLKRRLSKKDSEKSHAVMAVTSPPATRGPPPVPPRRSSSDVASIVAPVQPQSLDSYSMPSPVDPPQQTKQVPPPLPRRRSESSTKVPPSSRIPVRKSLVVAHQELSEVSASKHVADDKIAEYEAPPVSEQFHSTQPANPDKANMTTEQRTEDSVPDMTETKPAPSTICRGVKAEPSSLSSADTPVEVDPFFRKSFKKLVIKWSCRCCSRECIPVREESRCLCGHRLKEHPSSADDPRVKDPTKFKPFACTTSRCACRLFFYIVAEGAWILRCRCKHKHIDHDPSRAPFVCQKKKCSCAGFDSPWVCNCAHPWSDHVQTQEMKEFHPLQMDLCDELSKVYRTDLEAEPLQLMPAATL